MASITYCGISSEVSSGDIKHSSFEKWFSDNRISTSIGKKHKKRHVVYMDKGYMSSQNSLRHTIHGYSILNASSWSTKWLIELCCPSNYLFDWPTRKPCRRKARLYILSLSSYITCGGILKLKIQYLTCNLYNT